MAIFSAIGAAVAAVSGWIGGLGAVGAFALKAAVGVGLSLASQALAGKPKTQQQKFSINTGLAGGGALSRSIIMGRAATGGSLVWANTWGKEDGTQNAWITQVIALSDMPVKGLAEVWVDGLKVTYNPALNNQTVYGYSIPEYEKKGANLYVKFYDGNQTTADNQLVVGDSTPERPWDANRVGRGVAYVIIRARSTKGVFSGVPSMTFVVDGMRLYDPSKDGTNGGSGTQRYDTPATWGGDGDYLPAVQIYNLMRGIRFDGKWVYGFQGMTAARLPAANWVQQINKCRATILESGGLQPTYRSAGEIEINAPLSVAIDELLTTCQGKIAEAGGFYTLYLGAPDEAFFSITDGDIVSTQEQEFTPFFGLADSINGISATYPEPLDGYLERTAPPMYRPDLEILDGGRRLMADVQFTFVPYSEQVQRLMKSALLTALRYRRHTITLPPKFWRYAVPGETLRWTSERNGYVNKLFTIEGVADKANLEVTVDVLECDPADYSWTSSTEFQPPAPAASGAIVPQPRPFVSPYAEPYILQDAANRSRRPAIRLTWDNNEETLIGVIAIEWEIRLAGKTTVILSGSTDLVERGSTIISAGILPFTAYEIRMRYVHEEGLDPGIYSGYLPVTTPDIKLGIGDIEVELGVIADDTKSVFDEIGKEFDDVWKKVEHLGLSTALEGAVGQLDRSEIKIKVGESFARITEESEVRATETEALAKRTTKVEAETANNSAMITQEVVARTSRDYSIAAQIDTLSAETNTGISANRALIISEQQARSDGDSALATTINTLDAKANSISSSLASEETARADADAALSTRITTAQSNFTSGQNTLTSRIQTEEQTRASADSSMASQLTAIRADFDTAFAEGMIKFQAVAAPSGVSVRYSLLIRANANDSFKTTGFFVEIYNDGGTLRSRTAFDTDRFSIISGSQRQQVFTFDADGAKLAVANIGRITSGEIEIGKTLINSNGITVSS